MKKTKKQGLTSAKAKYLQRRIVQYYLFSAILSDSEKPLKPVKAAKKTQHKTSPVKQPPVLEKKPEVEPMPPELRELEAEIAEEPPPKKHRSIRSFHFHLSPRIKKFALAGLSVLLLVMLAQIFYPSNRALPLSRLEAHGYLGFASQQQILSSFQDFDSRVVTVHTHTKSLTSSYKDLGVTINPDQTAQTMTNYSMRDRLVPFSLFFKGNKNYAIERNLDDSQLNLFVRDVIAMASKQPKDAEVSMRGTQIVVVPSEEGYEYQASVLKSMVLQSDLGDKRQIVFAPTVLQPSISSDNAKFVTSRMQQRIDKPILINAEAKSMRVEPATIASWIDIKPKPEEKTVEMIFNRARVADTLRPLVSQVDITPVSTIVTYQNGLQAGRLEGSVGKILQFDNLVDRLVETTSPAISTIEANVQTVPPPEVIDRKYSKDSQGLQTLLQYWTANHKGDYSIDMRTANGRIEASINPHRLTPSFGIYRVYIASLVYGRVAAGSTSLNTVLQTGQTVDVCLDRMIRESDDACTNVLGALVGWGASDSLLQAQGFESTTLTEGAGLTTANDASDWMTKLMASNITTKQHADALIQKMVRQNIRTGIPAGSPGILVANKSGASGRTKHDMAIVYHPGGTYVLSVLSDGSDFSLIADLAREINKVMSQ